MQLKCSYLYNAGLIRAYEIGRYEKFVAKLDENPKGRD
jgi:hypothetical protein